MEKSMSMQYVPSVPGGLAQLARASALQAEGQRFESVILHRPKAGFRCADREGLRGNPFLPAHSSAPCNLELWKRSLT